MVKYGWRVSLGISHKDSKLAYPPGALIKQKAPSQAGLFAVITVANIANYVRFVQIEKRAEFAALLGIHPSTSIVDWFGIVYKNRALSQVGLY